MKKLKIRFIKLALLMFTFLLLIISCNNNSSSNKRNMLEKDFRVNCKVSHAWSKSVIKVKVTNVSKDDYFGYTDIEVRVGCFDKKGEQVDVLWGKINKPLCSGKSSTIELKTDKNIASASGDVRDASNYDCN